ncbi:MAG: hypothetical protein Q9225_000951 [Loekoesia sp. 1 TL-2023]
MSEADDSTIPDTPEADSGEVIKLDENDVFAWLRPLNKSASEAFDATVNLVIKHSPDFDHILTIGRNGAKTFRQPESYVLEDGEIVLVGACAYTFQYTDYFFSPAFEQDVTRYMRTHHKPLWSMNKYISPTSVGPPMLLGSYYCSPSAFAQGTFGKISAGWTENGGAVAIKTFKKPDKSEIISHTEIMKYIGRHDNIVQLLECVSRFDTGIPDAYCVYAPLAVASLAQVIQANHPDTAAKLALFVDYLNGLSYLHDQKGIMHRDICPNNLAITSLHSPKGIIIDLDSATTSHTSTDHMRGTIPFLAPEIMSLKLFKSGEKQPPPYGKSIDTWALGLTMYALHAGQSICWAQFATNSAPAVTYVTRNAHNSFQAKLGRDGQSAKDSENRKFLISITKMTMYKAEDRISASDALESVVPDRGGYGRGTIVPKAGRKRPWEQ